MARFVELVSLVGRFDDEKRAIHDVAILGAQSRNGRRYTEAALKDAVKVFEGAKVFIDHRKANGGKIEPHSVRDFVGRLEGVELSADGKVRAAQLRVHNKEFWPLMKVAEADNTAFGLSIDAEGQVKKGVNGEEVTAIRSAHSVDVVTNPATNVGLFESVESRNRRREMEWSEVTRKDLEENASELIDEIRKDWKGELETVEMERDELKAKLKEATDKKPDEAEKVREQLAELQEKVAAAELNAEVESLLREAGIADAPGALIEALKRGEDADARKALLELFAGNQPAGTKPRSHLKESGNKELTDVEVDARLDECWGAHQYA